MGIEKKHIGDVATFSMLNCPERWAVFNRPDLSGPSVKFNPTLYVVSCYEKIRRENTHAHTFYAQVIRNEMIYKVLNGC